ncbi:MAG: cytochrome c3 family protein, partial [Pseudomonadota bacterium]
MGSAEVRVSRPAGAGEIRRSAFLSPFRRTVEGAIAIGLAIFAIAAVAGPAAASLTPAEISDHLKTGFPIEGRHREADCESCHVNGVFEGTPQLCRACHNGTLAPGKPSRHIRSNNNCEDCHSSVGWTEVRFDHSGVTGACASCHDGRTAAGKSDGHISTSADCGECHSTANWASARFDHAGVTGSCFSCHNGT